MVAGGAKNVGKFHDNDDGGFSSIKVIGAGCKVELYANGDFTGWKKVLATGDYDAARMKLKHGISSLKVIQATTTTATELTTTTEKPATTTTKAGTIGDATGGTTTGGGTTDD